MPVRHAHECPHAEDEEEPLPQLSRLWTRPLDSLDTRLSKEVDPPAQVGCPTQVGSRDIGPDAQAALLAVYASQFGSYITLLWQVPALSLTAQAFLFTIALARDVDPGARVVTGVLSVVTSLMSIYLMFSHRIHAERQGQVAMDLAKQLGAQQDPEKDHRGAAGVWAGINRGSFALWIFGLGLFGMVGLGAAILGLTEL
jgi:hypothetical protein